MSLRRLACFSLLVGMAVGLAPRAVLAVDLLNLLSFKKVEANPNDPYRLTEKHGPWMIMATTFSGKNAARQAHDLVLELRREHRIEAYLHSKTFDFAKDLRGRGTNRLGGSLKWGYRNGNQSQQVAVLVGNFQSVNDPKAKKMKEKIKYVRPKALTDPGKEGSAQNFRNLRAVQAVVYAKMTGDTSRSQRGPMSHAFLTANPLLPKEYFAPKGVDKVVASMNRGVPHSLLECPGRYTVMIATFKGNVVLKQNDIRDIETQKKKMPKSKLLRATLIAHKLTLALRRKGYDAYQFHDRHASMVTIGSFNSVGTPRRDGKTEINPGIHKIIETFRARPTGTGGSAAPKNIAGIRLDVQPLPIEVPRRSFSTDYVRQ